MPIYVYRGLVCEHEFEEFQNIHAEALSTCPECGEPVERVICPPTIINSAPRTLGSLADRNSKKLSKEKLEVDKINKQEARLEARRQIAEQVGGVGVYDTKPEKPWWRTSDKPLDLKTVKNVKKYIETGEK